MLNPSPLGCFENVKSHRECRPLFRHSHNALDAPLFSRVVYNHIRVHALTSDSKYGKWSAASCPSNFRAEWGPDSKELSACDPKRIVLPGQIAAIFPREEPYARPPRFKH